MTAYTAIPNGDIDPDSPITTSLMTLMRDNPIAITEGSSGAPAIQTAALEQTDTQEAVTTETIRAGAVGQTELGAAVGQGQLKTATGSISKAAGTSTLFTLPGGEYGFYVQLKSSFTTSSSYDAHYVDSAAAVSLPTSYATKMTLAATAFTLYAQQRYVQASPPYDLGDGEIKLFIFVEIDNATGDVVSIYEAPEAPWHYNGPTNIKADFYTKKGIGYQRKKDAKDIDDAMVAAGHAKGLTRESAKALSILAYQDYHAAFNEAADIEIAISQDIKNADMNLIPRPMDGTADTTVVMLDPVSNLTAQLAETKKHDEFNLNELLHDGDLIITGEVTRAGPQGVPVHSYEWR